MSLPHCSPKAHETRETQRIQHGTEQMVCFKKGLVRNSAFQHLGIHFLNQILRSKLSYIGCLMQSRGPKGVSPPSVLPGPRNTTAQQQPPASASFTGTFGRTKSSNKRRRAQLQPKPFCHFKARVGTEGNIICREQNDFIFPQQSNILRSPST